MYVLLYQVTGITNKEPFIIKKKKNNFDTGKNNNNNTGNHKYLAT